MKRRIHVITPVVAVECETDVRSATPDIVRKSVMAESAGADAIVIDCFADPGLGPCREAVTVPVIGAGESSMHLAATLGHSFSVVTVVDSAIPLIENSARAYGVADRLASVRVIDIPVLALAGDTARLHRRLARESIAAVRDDGARVIVLGCTGMLGCAKPVAESLAKEFGAGIPVIDPLPTAMIAAAGIANLEIPSQRGHGWSRRLS